MGTTVRVTALILGVFAAAGIEAAAARPRRPAISPRIVNGVLTAGHPAVGALLSPSDPNTANLVCSGTLIGCQTFLTAAHCVCDGVGADCQGDNAPDPSDYVVFFQHAGFFAVSSIAVHPTFDFPVGDVAVVRLAAPVTGIAPAPINLTASIGPNTPATIAGFGRGGGSQSDYGLKRAGAVTTAPCSDGISGTTSVCWEFSAPVGAAGEDSNTCNGDSGGPLFVDLGCGDTVAGITSGGSSPTCLADDHSYDANVYFYRTYIQEQAGADLAARSCGAMPQAGDPGGAFTAFAGVLDAVTVQAEHTIDVPPGATELRVVLNGHDDGGSDFDLYVKRGSLPTTSDSDCRAIGPNQYGACAFDAPESGTWYVLVHRFAGSGTYQLTATSFLPGSPGAGSDGRACSDLNACTTADTCLGGYCSGSPAADGTSCDDGRTCTGADVCSAGICRGVDTPLAGCKTPLVAGTAPLAIRNENSDNRDAFSWRWVQGSSTNLGDLGDPTGSSGYELCVFDERANVHTLVMETAIPAGSGWLPTGRGYKYRDRTGSQAGITRVILRSGNEGNASIVLIGKGASLAPPPLPLAQDDSVTVQLVNENACWEARYSTSSENQSGRFRARSD